MALGYTGSRAAIEADVCVVGAGIVGLAHAHEAIRHGLRVVVLDRDERAVGASVRNFGHVFLSAMGDGVGLHAALLARERWLELGERAGLAISRAGTLVVARHEDELEVLAGLAGDGRRGGRMLTAAQAGRLAPIPTAELLGAMHGTLDLRVDPRAAAGALAALLGQAPEGPLWWRSPLQAIEPGVAHSLRAEVRAPLIVVCPGPDYGALPSSLLDGFADVTRCKLQMLRVAAPGGRRYEPALATGLSLVRYPAFGAQAGAARIRERLADRHQELLDAGIHLLITQLPDGDLIVGDTHEYGDTVSPFGDERLDQLLLTEARRLLGTDELRVRERWHGVYPAAPGGPFRITTPLPGVRVVEVVSGVGMTTAFGLAARVLDEALALGDGAYALA